MGIDVHGFHFLRLAAASAPLGRTATIGRQVVDTPPAVIRAAFPSSPEFSGYCENMLAELFGSTVVESFDNSTYEGATYVADFNRALKVQTTYDTVVDFGCLEHVFDVRQAFENCATLCAEGGRILHLLPANNYCGHGFWQFSPELFFSLYSQQNGFAETRVFLADLSDERRWWEVTQPPPGKRINATSSGPLYVLCSTRRVGAVSFETVQQSDYVHLWNAAPTPEAAAPARAKTQPEFVRALRRGLKTFKPKYRVGRSHPYLVERRISTLV